MRRGDEGGDEGSEILGLCEEMNALSAKVKLFIRKNSSLSICDGLLQTLILILILIPIPILISTFVETQLNFSFYSL